jgi:twitching motility protein PilT
VKSEASDVHVHADAEARMRQLGKLVPITEKPLAAEATLEALTAILTPWQRSVFDEAGEIDFAYEVPGLSRFRANVYRQQNGANGVFHIIPGTVPTLTALGLPQALAKLTNYHQGLLLLTGPAGCGKTSTLAALTNIINEERSDHILTIEDPIEYVFESKRCIVNQRQVGRHTETFASGLRGALREDPDIICIGELRDLETISLALSAAETGHLVLATLHTGSAIGTINRIVGAYPPAQQPQIRSMMSESLRAITSQRLLPGTDGQSHVALETLFITRAVSALIRDNRTFQIGSIMQTGKSQGMKLLDDSLRELLEAGRISEEVALANCNDPRRLGGE